MEELSRRLGEFLAQCLDGGFVLPFHVTAVGVNGGMLFFRAVEGDDGLDITLLAQHDAGLTTPINLMIIDATGSAARVVIGGNHGEQTVQMLH